MGGKEICGLRLGLIGVEDDVFLRSAGRQLSKLMSRVVDTLLKDVHVGNVKRETSSVEERVTQGCLAYAVKGEAGIDDALDD